MKGFLILIGILASCAIIVVPILYFTTDIFTGESESSNAHYTPYQPSYPTPAQEQEIGRLTDHVLKGGYFHDWTETIQAGKTISISWEADGRLNVWILTQTQYDYFKVWGTTFRYEALKSGRSGTLVHRVSNTDTYHLIVQNPSLFENIKVYSAVARVQ